MLFQMCYGPEIRTIYECIQKGEANNIRDLKDKMQYQDDGDISSLIESTIVFLKDLEFIEQREHSYHPMVPNWSTLHALLKFRELAKVSEANSLNYIFASIYEEFFVKPNKLFISNIHYHVNSSFPKTMVGHEKINAWKRIMEYFGIGRRAYAGFYALPQIELIIEIIRKIGPWEGGLHPYCEQFIDPILPCMTKDGKVFNGLLFGLVALSERGHIKVEMKQDLPFMSYGPNYEWNWIRIGEDVNL
ncbi:hypothetical protein [Gorillibacterium sp. sgz5001074]|uniref:hypothetical protein n=1 Tax=Gorillibacterium sp. sgz5001074 TaxID=3446695 RepID=UPI003F667734